MKKLEELEERKSRDVAGKMSLQAVEVHAARQTLEDLEAYLNETLATSLELVSPMQLAEAMQFREQLRDAVKLQRQVVHQAEAVYESLRAKWIAGHIRSNMLGTVAHRFGVEEDRLQMTLERKTEDELATAAVARLKNKKNGL